MSRPTDGGSPSPSSITNDLKPFVFGGVASCVAEAATFPIDTAKTRLQLQGQKMEAQNAEMSFAQGRHCVTPYRGMVDCWGRICQEEGYQVLYRGLSPALLRQATYGTIKFGLYYTIKGWLPGEESAVKNLGCAVIAGSVSAAIATPTDLLKVRHQAKWVSEGDNRPRPRHKGVFGCFRDIYLNEGARGLWRGVVPTAQRAAVVAGVQLPVYDYSKMFFIRHQLMVDGAGNHLVSSFCAGLCACLASSPMDVVRTRMMNQRKLIVKSSRRGSETHIYRSSLHCALVTVRSEGLGALYKGFVPSFTRMGPWNIIFFLVYEQMKKTFTDAQQQQQTNSDKRQSNTACRQQQQQRKQS